MRGVYGGGPDRRAHLIGPNGAQKGCLKREIEREWCCVILLLFLWYEKRKAMSEGKRRWEEEGKEGEDELNHKENTKDGTITEGEGDKVEGC